LQLYFTQLKDYTLFHFLQKPLAQIGHKVTYIPYHCWYRVQRSLWG